MGKTNELKPCPFCGSENLEVRDIPFVGYAVTCWNDNCLVRGPSRGKAEEAIEVWNKAWNRRAENMRLKEFTTFDYNTVLLDTDGISSVYETSINGCRATVVVMQQGESYTLCMSISEFKRKLNID